MIQLLQSLPVIIQSSKSGEEESMYDIVMHHLTDHPIHDGFIGKINNLFFHEKLFGIFDMTIT
ncbi:MAG TPA: hypothetical protein PLN01_04225, partial [Spirochaetota bacterium]|nr:hypothetical protein [Spirochaetota bacterium]